MTVDYRSRRDADVTDVDITDFFSRRFPGLLNTAAPCIEPWLACNTPSNLTIDCDGASWHLSARDGQIQVAREAGTTGLHVKLSAAEFSGLVNDLYTPMTFFVGGSLSILRGQMGDFLDWWLLLRAVIDQRPIHTPGETEFRDRFGEPLDLCRAFNPGDSREDMRHFLETAGFLHIGGLFSEREMAAISADIDRYQDTYYEGDGSSWWATTGNGARRLVRLQRFDQVSAATRDLLADPRFTMLGQISGDGHTHKGLEGNAIEALIKPLDVVQGISDLPWHKDCSLGRHSYDCCSITAGISVTGASADSGQLRVIAGSHRALMWPALISKPELYGLPVVDLPTRTGDVTLHLSCTHHMAQAPTARERRVMYTSFRLPSVNVESNTESRARINQVREAAYRNVSQ
ncbi:MAG: phytanoyl-CoA dioxygenase family protein [Halioglobus sp.]